MIRVKHWLETVSFYLGLGLLLYTLNQTNPRQVILSGVNGNDVGDGLQTVRSRFDSYSTSSDCFSLKNWRDLHFHEHLLSRNFKGLSSKCSVEAIKNTTLCKVQIVSNGLSTDVIECLVSSQRNWWWRREMSAVFLGQHFFHRLRLLSHVPLNTFTIANFVVERYEGCLNCLFWFRSFGILFVFSAFFKIFLGV